MPSLDTARKMSRSDYNERKTIGQIHKDNSDDIMEMTWDNDIQSKVCYVYDYYHDDSPELSKGMTYKNTTKTKLDAKFIISSYSSIDKDQVAYHIMFRPSQKVEFNHRDELFYFERYREKYGMEFPMGLYIDIPNEKNVYVRWMVCGIEQGNQFIKYSVLPCDYRFQWINVEDTKRTKYQVWGCTRSMNSYTSGIWIDRYIYSLDNVNKAILPLNPITENIFYVGEDGENQRMFVSAKTKHPIVWKISKIENTKPFGILKLTMKQDSFNQNTDYIEKDNEGNIIGMWADYYDYKILPINPPTEDYSYPRSILKATSSIIKDGGSFRTITASYFDEEDNDISDNYSSTTHLWTYTIDDIDVSEYVEEKIQPNKNSIKIKFSTPNRDYLNKILTVKCTVENIDCSTQLEIGI